MRKEEKKVKILVGCTGFVGSNLYASGAFDRGFHASDIRDAYGLHPDLLVYAGVRAEKYLADAYPEEDFRHICQALENIRAIAPRRLALISTIDVYPQPFKVDEHSKIEWGDGKGYGANRFWLEKTVRKEYPDSLLVRLPALYGKNLKKNFIYDFLHPVPRRLKAEKYYELAKGSAFIAKSYQDMGNGFYQCQGSGIEEEKLKAEFQKQGFSALHFTDSRSAYQFYPLSRLWKDLQIGLADSLHILNLATEPVSAAEVYRILENGDFCNELKKEPARYDMKTVYAERFGGKEGYLWSRKEVLEDIRRFVADILTEGR